MSVESIGARVAAIQQHVAEMTGTATAADSSSSSTFAQALQSAQGTTTPTATAASTATGLNAGASSQYDAQITAAATKYGIDPALLKGLIRQESNFDASAQSGAGAQGLTQLMPATAKSLGVDASDPAQAIDGGARYLKTQLDRFGGDESKALAAYNAGPGAVAKYGGVPPYAETQGYVKSVLAFAAQYRGTGGATDATSALATAGLTTGALTSSATSALPAATLPVSAASLLATATATGDGSDSATSTPGVLDYSTI